MITGTGGYWRIGNTSTYAYDYWPTEPINYIEAHEVGEIFKSANPLETGFGEREISRGEKKLRKAKRGW